MQRYYGNLRSKLRNIEGFIFETPYGHPTKPGGQLLLAKFVDEAATARWRNN
jgi:hypothetical protein